MATLSQYRQENVYLAIQAVWQEEQCSVQVLYEIAKISRSSYYKWLNRKTSSRELENQQLTDAMLSLYEKVDGIYGYRRLTLHLRRQTQRRINHKLSCYFSNWAAYRCEGSRSLWASMGSNRF
ncbi:transposase [Brevibacterium sp. JNUCC-42]|nr:transposase [Brevibacterium sp. JNUCC-42]